MSTVLLENKIKQLPDSYITLVNNYVDDLLSKVQKIQNLQGSLSNYANKNLQEQEKSAWANESIRNYLDV